MQILQVLRKKNKTFVLSINLCTNAVLQPISCVWCLTLCSWKSCASRIWISKSLLHSFKILTMVLCCQTLWYFIPMEILPNFGGVHYLKVWQLHGSPITSPVVEGKWSYIIEFPKKRLGKQRQSRGCRCVFYLPERITGTLRFSEQNNTISL